MDEKRAADRAAAEARLEMLFRRHHRDVAAYVRRRAGPDLVDDVVAETFLVAWRRLEHVPAEARPWLLGVARKALATQRRSASRRRSLATRLQESSRTVEPGEVASGSGVTDALARLTEKDREAITLIAWEGLTPKEAAATLGHSPVAFRVRLHRAKRRFRGLLEPLPPQADGAGLVPTDEALTRGALKK
jgi:RNA polymerase sigma-70 factor (ECF subfamily)